MGKAMWSQTCLLYTSSVVEEAETQKRFPYRIYDLLGRDFTRNITRFEFALLAVRTYELLANDYDTLSVTTYKDPELGQSDTLFFRDCKDEDYIVDLSLIHISWRPSSGSFHPRR